MISFCVLIASGRQLTKFGSCGLEIYSLCMLAWLSGGGVLSGYIYRRSLPGLVSEVLILVCLADFVCARVACFRT